MQRPQPTGADIRPATRALLANTFGTLPDETDEIWHERPVGSREFFRDFIDEPLYPLQQEYCDALLGMDPLEWDTTYQEGHAFWGKGSGKDRTNAKIFAYVIYRLLCMRDPQSALGLAAGSPLDLVNVSINAKLAKDVFFANLKGILKAAKNPVTGQNWFAEQGVNLTEGKDSKKLEINFPRQITAHSLNSEKYTGEGLNILIGVMDEVGSFPVKAGMDLYKALRRTIKSRFSRGHGKLLLLSYKYHDNDLMEILFKQGLKKSHVFSSHHATWEVNLGVDRQGLAEEYADDPEGAQMAFECKGEGHVGGYIRRRQTIAQAVDGENPVLGGLLSTDSVRGLQFADWFKGSPGRLYAVHIDLAKGKVSDRGDAVGFVMAHPEQMFANYDRRTVDELLELGIDITGNLDSDPQAPRKGIRVDLALQITAPPDSEVDFQDLRQLVYRLKQMHGFKIIYVGFDGFEAIDSTQDINRHGIDAGIISVDKTMVPYDTLKSKLYQGLLRYYAHPILQRELRELERKGNKVDHPEYSYERQVTEGAVKGSKDVSDALAGVAFKIENDIHLDADIFFGSLGGGDNDYGEGRNDQVGQHRWIVGADGKVRSDDG